MEVVDQTQFIRAHQRFDVSYGNYLTGSITQQSHAGLRLASIGLGGCGFIAVESPENLFPPAQVDCAINVSTGYKDKEVRFSLKGSLIYVSMKPDFSRNSFLFGVQFEESEHQRLRPVIEKLEILASRGQIDKI